VIYPSKMLNPPAYARMPESGNAMEARGTPCCAADAMWVREVDRDRQKKINELEYSPARTAERVAAVLPTAIRLPRV